MGIFSNTGSIATCAQCLNKAEVRVYPNDNPDPICEDCYQDNQKLEHKIATKAEETRSLNTPLPEAKETALFQSSSEREKYIDVICRMASDEWVKKFTKDIKRVLVNDWQTIIRNERWFSLLELRRYALQLSPDMDKPPIKKVGFNLLEESLPQPMVRVRRTRKHKQKKEPINA